ncbi:MAG: hypothetical protein CL889_04210 [Dehalococcoidia bacterium]|nr:hypothetical protein [Dehalococcoidia bacterium]
MEDITERIDRIARAACKREEATEIATERIMALIQRIRKRGKIGDSDLEREFFSIGEGMKDAE